MRAFGPLRERWASVYNEPDGAFRMRKARWQRLGWGISGGGTCNDGSDGAFQECGGVNPKHKIFYLQTAHAAIERQIGVLELGYSTVKTDHIFWAAAVCSPVRNVDFE